MNSRASNLLLLDRLRDLQIREMNLTREPPCAIGTRPTYAHQKETPQVKVFVLLGTFAIIVQFLFLQAGAR
jgi:hypothetical protein